MGNFHTDSLIKQPQTKVFSFALQLFLSPLHFQFSFCMKQEDEYTPTEVFIAADLTAQLLRDWSPQKQSPNTWQLSPATLSCWLLLFWRGQHSHTSASNTGNSSTPSGSSCSGKPLLEEVSANSPHFVLEQLWSAHLLFQQRPLESCRFWKGAIAHCRGRCPQLPLPLRSSYQCALSAGEPLLPVTHTASSCQTMLLGRD